MSAARSSRPSVLLGLALGGVLLGHTVAYRLLLPDAHARTLELAASGHGYLSGANVVGLVAAVIALAALFLGRVLRADQMDLRHLTPRLIGFQMAVFVAMEVLERISSGGGVQHLPAVLLVGLARPGGGRAARDPLRPAAAACGCGDRRPSQHSPHVGGRARDGRRRLHHAAAASPHRVATRSRSSVVVVA